jgi:hypothetical protein
MHVVILDLPNRSAEIPAGIKCKAHLDF